MNKGVTALLVSHDLNMIEKYYNRVIWLDKGRIVREGKAKEVVKEYVGRN